MIRLAERPCRVQTLPYVIRLLSVPSEFTGFYHMICLLRCVFHVYVSIINCALGGYLIMPKIETEDVFTLFMSQKLRFGVTVCDVLKYARNLSNVYQIITALYFVVYVLRIPC